jgi:hypothetical protein
MKLRFIFLIFAFAPTFTTAPGQSEDHWEDYQPRTLQSIIDLHRDNILELDSKNDSKKKVLLTGESFPSQTRIIYLAESRPLPPQKKMVLNLWRKMLKDQAPAAGEFATEVLFKEGTVEHWVAVRQPLLDPLSKEEKKGDSVDAYIIWVGAIKVGTRWEWLFAMNAFQAVR